jgi:hypothetical protein
MSDEPIGRKEAEAKELILAQHLAFVETSNIRDHAQIMEGLKTLGGKFDDVSKRLFHDNGVKSMQTIQDRHSRALCTIGWTVSATVLTLLGLLVNGLWKAIMHAGVTP